MSDEWRRRRQLPCCWLSRCQEGIPRRERACKKIVAFVDREGGSFFQDWSALFVQEDESGGRICFYYPRLSPSRPGGGPFQNEGQRIIQDSLAVVSLHASFLALPYTDENDSEVVLCYRSYFPAGMSALY